MGALRSKHRNLSTRRRMLKKPGEFFSSGPHRILWSEERFYSPQKNGSFEVNYLVLGGYQPILPIPTRCFFPKNICKTTMLVPDIRFLCRVTRLGQCFFLRGSVFLFPIVIFYRQVKTGIRHHYHHLPTLSPEHLYLTPILKPRYLHSLLNWT
jgi:hypothetical protein